jgi:hypothetical protein
VRQVSSCEVAYRTQGFQWKADYTVVVNGDQTRADVGGWVSIENNSGKKYVNAKLKLIAGSVNVMQPPTPVYRLNTMKLGFSGVEAAPSFS